MWPGFEGFFFELVNGRCGAVRRCFYYFLSTFSICMAYHTGLCMCLFPFHYYYCRCHLHLFFSRIFSFLTYIEALEGSHPGRVLLYISFLSKLPRRSPYSPLIDGMGGNLEGIYQRERGVRTRIETKLLNSFERLCTKSYRTTDRKREKKTLAII